MHLNATIFLLKHRIQKNHTELQQNVNNDNYILNNQSYDNGKQNGGVGGGEKTEFRSIIKQIS